MVTTRRTCSSLTRETDVRRGVRPDETFFDGRTDLVTPEKRRNAVFVIGVVLRRVPFARHSCCARDEKTREFYLPLKSLNVEQRRLHAGTNFSNNPGDQGPSRRSILRRNIEHNKLLCRRADNERERNSSTRTDGRTDGTGRGGTRSGLTKFFARKLPYSENKYPTTNRRDGRVCRTINNSTAKVRLNNIISAVSTSGAITHPDDFKTRLETN